ncbi:hypothetical protein STEG23_036856, partial [Scotinomys teguina]
MEPDSVIEDKTIELMKTSAVDVDQKTSAVDVDQKTSAVDVDYGTFGQFIMLMTSVLQ